MARGHLLRVILRVIAGRGERAGPRVDDDDTGGGPERYLHTLCDSLEHIGQAIPPLQDAARGVLEDVARESKRRIELRGPALSGVNSRVQALIDETNHTKAAIDREWAPRARQLRTGLRHGAFADVTGTLRPLLDVLADVDRQVRNAGMTMNIDAIRREPLADRRAVVFMHARALQDASDEARRAYASIVEREKGREHMESSQGQPQNASRRAVILTALPVEQKAVRAHLLDSREDQHRRGTIYERGYIAGVGGTWEVLLAEIGAGDSSAAHECERAIQHFDPAVVLFVGVAGGIKDVALGDVVAATEVHQYEAGKAMEVFQTRPTQHQSAYELVQRARAEARTDRWRARLPAEESTPMPSVHVAPIAAGEKVVADKRSDVYKLLRRSYGQVVAVEMEGYGFLRAAYANAQVRALVVRGISDLIDGKGAADAAGSQARAARHAAAFAVEVLVQYTPPEAMSGTPDIAVPSAETILIREQRGRDHLADLKAGIVRPIADHTTTFVRQVARYGVFSDQYTDGSLYSSLYRPAVSPDHPLSKDWPAHFPAWAARVREFDHAATRYQEEALGVLNEIHARMVTHQGEQYWTPTLDGAVLAWLLTLDDRRRPVERVPGGPFGRWALYVSDPSGGHALLGDDENWQGVEQDVWLVEQDQDLRARGGRVRTAARALEDILARQYLEGTCAFITPEHGTAQRAEASQRASGSFIAQADGGSTATVNVSGARG